MQLMLCNCRAAKTLQQGVSIFEVLVAMLVLSLGLLSFAKLQFVALRQNQTALQHVWATQLVRSLYESMQANKVAAIAGAYTYDGMPLAAPSNLCAQQFCSAEQIAHLDLYHWSQQVQKLLPATVAIVQCENNCVLPVHYSLQLQLPAEQGVVALTEWRFDFLL